MSNTQRIDIQPSMVMQGYTIPISSFSITSGSYGSVGHARVTTDISSLRGQGIRMLDLQPSLQHVDIKISVSIGGTTSLLYGGGLLDVVYDYDDDNVTFNSRDYAGPLVDQRRVLTGLATTAESVLGPLVPGQVLTGALVQGENQSISDIVVSIANMFGLSPVVQLTGSSPVSSWGTAFGGSATSYAPIPMSLWAMLVRLATDTGNEVYVTPDKKLVFGAPGEGLKTLQLSYRNPTPASGTLPCRKLHLRHNTRRNATFRVLVISYNPSLGQTTVGRATVIGDDAAGPSLAAGLHTGSDALAVEEQLVAMAQPPQEADAPPPEISPSFFGQVQLYTFHWDGLTNDQANSRAAAYALDIMKRQYILEGELDGVPLLPTQPIQLSGTLADEAFGNTFYIMGFRHKFRMPRQGSGLGFVSEFSALDLPIFGNK